VILGSRPRRRGRLPAAFRRLWPLSGAEKITMGSPTQESSAWVELRSLDYLVAVRGLRGRYLLVPFEATWNGAAVVVTGVLERTAVVHLVGTDGAPEDRKLAKRSQLLVSPGSLRWAHPVRRGWSSGFGPQPQESLNHCSACRRTAAETEFRGYRATYCLECSRKRQREIDEGRKKRAGKAGSAAPERLVDS
jgi:hypothetical protein